MARLPRIRLAERAHRAAGHPVADPGKAGRRCCPPEPRCVADPASMRARMWPVPAPAVSAAIARTRARSVILGLRPASKFVRRPRRHTEMVGWRAAQMAFMHRCVRGLQVATEAYRVKQRVGGAIGREPCPQYFQALGG